MNKKVKGILAGIKKYITDIYGDKIKKIIIYGSYARGDATKNSDIDLLLVIDESLESLEVEDALNEFLFQIILREGELVSIMAIPENLFNTYNSPFLLNVKEEGISI
jgi:predicted nucleotidyltransferase